MSAMILLVCLLPLVSALIVKNVPDDLGHQLENQGKGHTEICYCELDEFKGQSKDEAVCGCGSDNGSRPEEYGKSKQKRDTSSASMKSSGGSSGDGKRKRKRESSPPSSKNSDDHDLHGKEKNEEEKVKKTIVEKTKKKKVAKNKKKKKNPESKKRNKKKDKKKEDEKVESTTEESTTKESTTEDTATKEPPCQPKHKHPCQSIRKHPCQPNRKPPCQPNRKHPCQLNRRKNYGDLLYMTLDTDEGYLYICPGGLDSENKYGETLEGLGRRRGSNGRKNFGRNHGNGRRKQRYGENPPHSGIFKPNINSHRSIPNGWVQGSNIIPGRLIVSNSHGKPDIIPGTLLLGSQGNLSFSKSVENPFPDSVRSTEKRGVGCTGCGGFPAWIWCPGGLGSYETISNIPYGYATNEYQPLNTNNIATLYRSNFFPQFQDIPSSDAVKEDVKPFKDAIVDPNMPKKRWEEITPDQLPGPKPPRIPGTVVVRSKRPETPQGPGNTPGVESISKRSVFSLEPFKKLFGGEALQARNSLFTECPWHPPGGGAGCPGWGYGPGIGPGPNSNMGRIPPGRRGPGGGDVPDISKLFILGTFKGTRMLNSGQYCQNSQSPIPPLSYTNKIPMAFLPYIPNRSHGKKNSRNCIKIPIGTLSRHTSYRTGNQRDELHYRSLPARDRMNSLEDSGLKPRHPNIEPGDEIVGSDMPKGPSIIVNPESLP